MTARNKQNEVLYDIKVSNAKQLLSPQGFDSFTEAMYHTIDSDKHSSMNKFTSTMEHIYIGFDGPEERDAEEDIIDDSIIKSLWEINREALDNIMLINNFSKEEMDNYILCGLAILDASPKDRQTRLYRVDLYP